CRGVGDWVYRDEIDSKRAAACSTAFAIDWPGVAERSACNSLQSRFAYLEGSCACRCSCRCVSCAGGIDIADDYAECDRRGCRNAESTRGAPCKTSDQRRVSESKRANKFTSRIRRTEPGCYPSAKKNVRQGDCRGRQGNSCFRALGLSLRWHGGVPRYARLDSRP